MASCAKRVCALSGCLLLSWIMPALGQSVDDALSLLEAATASVRSFDVEVSLQKTFYLRYEIVGSPRESEGRPVQKARPLAPGETPTILNERHRQLFDSGKWRYERLKSDGQTDQVVVSDGELQKGLDLGGKGGAIRKPVPKLIPEGCDYLEAFRSAAGKIGLVRIFRQRPGTRLVSSGAREIVIQADPDKAKGRDFPGWGFRVMLDLDKNCMPRRIDRFIEVPGSSEAVVRSTEVKAFRKLDDGSWVPVEVLTRFLETAADRRGQLRHEVLATVNVERSRWNTPLNGDLFDLSFPAGIQIADKTRNVLFITGNPNPESNLKELLNQAKSISVLHPSKPEENGSMTTLALSCGVMAVLVVALGAVYRARRRRMLAGR